MVSIYRSIHIVMAFLVKSPLNLRLILLQMLVLVLAPLWILKLTHYFTFPLPQLFSSPTLIPQPPYQTLTSLSEIDLMITIWNLSLFGLFFLQHILMARLAFKTLLSSIWYMFPTYERHIYNLTSSFLLLIVLEYQQPQNYLLFTLPSWICLPLSITGLFFFVDANLQMEGSLFLPYKFSELFGSRQITAKENDY